MLTENFKRSNQNLRSLFGLREKQVRVVAGVAIAAVRCLPLCVAKVAVRARECGATAHIASAKSDI